MSLNPPKASAIAVSAGWLSTTSLFATVRNVKWETLENSKFNTGSLIAHHLQRFV